MRARALLVVVALVACGEPAPSDPVPVPAPRPSPAPPGLRLPDGVTPLAYDLRLEVNPDDPLIHGHVEITTRLAARTDVIWLHAVGLDISSATFRDGGYTGVLTTLPGTEEMIGLRLDRPAGPGEIVLAFAYTGKLATGQEGLFRQRQDDRWFVMSQSESVFARRFVPCFDEPRFKPAWRVTLVVPAKQVALANGPMLAEQPLPDGRREVRFAEVARMPSYLLAIAVGPFALVDAGRIGRARIPVRIAVAPADAKRVREARAALPEIAAALERYLDRPLPGPKLDLVAVPLFFGAMENPGLITFARAFLVDDASKRGHRAVFVGIAAHELAHQWFGNTVTHAWWDELWLTEAVSELLAEHVARELGVHTDDRLASHVEGMMIPDEATPPRALRQPITTTADIEATFGTQAYARGRWVLETFEQFAGATAMRDALRAYVAEHAGGTVTVAELSRALAATSSPAVGAALASVAERPGVPVVELALQCDGPAPRVVAHARDGVTVPICVRHAGGTKPTCALVGDRTEVALVSTGCPAWVVGNAGGAGYYRVVWDGEPPVGALATATPLEQYALATDLLVALRGDRPPVAAVARLLRALVERGQPHALRAALSLARELDRVVPESERPAWAAWLGERFRTQLASSALLSPRGRFEQEARDDLLALAPELIAPAVVRRARAIVDRALAEPDPPTGAVVSALRIAAPHGDAAWFAKVLAVAQRPPQAALAAELLGRLDAFGPAFAPALVAAVVNPGGPAEHLVRSLTRLLERPGAADAAWRAISPQFAAVVARVSAIDARELLAAAQHLCDASARADVERVVTPLVDRITDGRATLARSLAAIDRCHARRAAAGSLAQALP